VAEVNAAMPTIVFEVRDPAGNDLSAVSVTMDGQPLVGRLEGTALSIDPGEHSFVFVSQETEPVNKRWVIREGEKGRREKVILGGELIEPPRAAEAHSPKPERVDPAAPADTAMSASTLRTIGIVTGGLGVVAIGIAIGEQVTAKNRDSHSQNAAEERADQAFIHALHEQAVQAQTYAIVFGVVGTAAVVTGMYLWLSNLEDEKANATSLRLGAVPSIKHPGAEVSWVGSF
jgi:hypothetical protein